MQIDSIKNYDIFIETNGILVISGGILGNQILSKVTCIDA